MENYEKPLSELKEIDKLLEKFRESSDEKHFRLSSEAAMKNTQANKDYQRYHLQYLLEDGYLIQPKNHLNQPLSEYYISSKGRIKILLGGFAEEFIQKNLDKQTAQSNEKKLRNYTFWMAVAAVGLAILEIAKILLDHPYILRPHCPH
jgi:hypothetical protein